LGWVLKIALVVILGLVVFAAYARLAPSDAARWNALPADIAPGDGAGSATRVIPDAGNTMDKLDQIIRSTPRTVVLAGSVSDGMITYITRSTLFGFPDYTTMSRRDGQVVVYSRLRFGKSDMGVNAKRLDGWLAQL